MEEINAAQPEAQELVQPPIQTPAEPKKKKFSKSKWLLLSSIILVLIIISTSAAYFFLNSKSQVACTLEAKLCPDGSSVGRTGPKCEFTACPKTTPTPDPTANWKTLDSSVDISKDFYVPGGRPKDFTLKYPSSWLLQGNSLYPEGKTPSVNGHPIRVILGYWGTDLPEFTAVKNLPAGKASYYWGGETFTMGYAVFDNGDIFSFNYIPNSKAQQYKPIFDAILNTIKFTDQNSPTPTCRPRPACLDATPRCLIPETSDMCPPTITPSQ